MILFFWFDEDIFCEYVPPKAIYILYFDQVLDIYQKQRMAWYSQQLEEAKISLLKTVFKDNDIPYKTDRDTYNLPETNLDEDDEQPYNSRVVFTYAEDEYTVYLPDCRLMKNQMAEKLNKSLNRKNIKSRVEILGKHR